MSALAGSPSPVPRHVVLVPDGNRRWARLHGVSLAETYTRSVLAINRTIDQLIDRGVECVSGWATSDKTEMRSQDDIKPVMKALRAFLHVVTTTYPKRGIRFRVVGARDRLDAVDDLICREIEVAEKETQDGRATVIVLLDYGSRDELVRAYRRLHAAGGGFAGLTPEGLAGFLDTGGLPDPDLIIRSGGCYRLSGLYGFQSTNAEIRVLDDVLMPDFTADMVDELLARYAQGTERAQQPMR